MLILLGLARIVHAQVVNSQIKYVSVAPSGACAATGIDLLTPNGTLYTCASGTWTAVSSSSGVTSIAAGTGISVNAATGAVTVTNTAPGASPAGSTNNPQFNAGGGLFGGTAGAFANTTGLYDKGSAVYNVKAYNASGSSVNTTTVGSTTSGSTSVVVAASDYVVGHGIYIAGAGAAGANYIGSVTVVAGTTLTISPATSTTVANGTVVHHDDTAAAQAAVDAPGGIGGLVYFPAGYYYFSSQLTLRTSTRISGASQGSGMSNTGTTGITVVDCRQLTGVAGCFFWPNTSFSAALSDISLLGPSGVGTTEGVDFGQSATDCLVQNVYIDFFGMGIGLNRVKGCTIINAHTNNTNGQGLDVYGGQNVNVYGGSFQNNTLTGVGGGNIVVENNANAISFYNSFIDEAFGVGAATVLVRDTASYVSFNNMTMYFNKDGYGFDIGASTDHVSLTNINIGPFSAGFHGVLNTIRIAGTNHWLQNVVTVPNGGGDIADTSTTTTYLNVNGVTNFPYVAQATGWKSSDGTAGTTGNGFKNGLCVTASGACTGGLLPTLKGTSASIGGGLLTAGTCASGTATVTGATTSMTSTLPIGATYPGDGFEIYSYVSSANTVTVKVCALVALTPTATTYSVAVIP